MLKFSLVYILMSFFADAYALGINDHSMTFRPTIEQAEKIEANEKQREEEITIDEKNDSSEEDRRKLSGEGRRNRRSNRNKNKNLDPLEDLVSSQPDSFESSNTDSVSPVQNNFVELESASKLQSPFLSSNSFSNPSFMTPLQSPNPPFASSNQRLESYAVCVSPEFENTNIGRCNLLQNNTIFKSSGGQNNSALMDLLSSVSAETHGYSYSMAPDTSTDGFCENCYPHVFNRTDFGRKFEFNDYKKVVYGKVNVASQANEFNSSEIMNGINRLSALYYDNKERIDSYIQKELEGKKLVKGSKEFKEKFSQKIKNLTCNKTNLIKGLIDHWVSTNLEAANAEKSSSEQKKMFKAQAEGCKARFKSFQEKFFKYNIDDSAINLKALNNSNIVDDLNIDELLSENSNLVSSQEANINEKRLDKNGQLGFLKDAIIAFNDNKEKIQKLCEDRNYIGAKSSDEYFEISNQKTLRDKYQVLMTDFENLEDRMKFIDSSISSAPKALPLLNSLDEACEINDQVKDKLEVEQYLDILGLGAIADTKKLIKVMERSEAELCNTQQLNKMAVKICFDVVEPTKEEVETYIAQTLLSGEDIDKKDAMVFAQMACKYGGLDIESKKKELSTKMSSGSTFVQAARRLGQSADEQQKDIESLASKNTGKGKKGRILNGLASAIKSSKENSASQVASSEASTSNVVPNESIRDIEEDSNYTNALNSVADNFQNSQMNNQKSLDQHLNNILDSDPEMKNEVTDLSDKLQEQLLPGQDSKKVMEEVLTGKRKLSADDLACSEPDEKKCKKTNQDLLDEIEKLKRQVAQKTEQEMKDKTSENEDLRAEIAALRKELDDFKKIPAASTSSKSSRSPASISASSSNELSGSNNLSSYETSRILTTPKSGLSSDRIGETPIDNNVTQMIPPTVTKDPTQFVEGNDFNLSTKNEGAGLYLSINQKGMKDYPVDIGKVVMDNNGKLQQIYLKNSETPIDITKLSKESLTALETFISKRQKDIPRVEREVGRKIATVESSIVENSTEIVRYQELLCSLNSSRQGCEN